MPRLDTNKPKWTAVMVRKASSTACCMVHVLRALMYGLENKWSFAK